LIFGFCPRTAVVLNTLAHRRFKLFLIGASRRRV
jgi:hypothetical protein